jgi:hypothetical protein
MEPTREEIIGSLRNLVRACGHQSANPPCAFNSKGCNCGQAMLQRIALAQANSLLRRIDEKNL